MDTSVLWLEKAVQGGKWVDLSPYKNTGTMTGANWKENSIRFDGIDDYTNCLNDGSLDLTTSITMEALIKPNGANEIGYIIAKGIPTINQRYNMYWHGLNDTLSLYESGTNIPSNNVFTDGNVWVHTVITVNGTAISFYRNGVAAGTATLTNPLGSNSDHLHIGNRVGGASPSTFFSGRIALIRIYNNVLTVQQVKECYEQSYRLI